MTTERPAHPSFREILRVRACRKILFALDLEATKVAQLIGLNRNTVNRYFVASRQRLAQAWEQARPLWIKQTGMNLLSVSFVPTLIFGM